MSQYEELIKALRRCQFGHGMCAECPYYGHKGKWNGEDLSDCDDKMHLDAAAAIEELQAEVERLQVDVDAAYAHMEVQDESAGSL